MKYRNIAVDVRYLLMVYCVLKLCTVIGILRRAVLYIGFCLTGPFSLCLESFVFMFVYFMFGFRTAYVLYYCNKVGWTRWD